MRDGRDAVTAAHAALPHARFDHAERLTSGDRARVHRMRLTDDTGRRSVIVKQYVTLGEGWVREAAALDVLPPGHGTPRLLATAPHAAVLVFADAGSGANLAEALLGRDAAAADVLLREWAETLAAVHVAGSGKREPFRAALADRAAQQGRDAVRETRLDVDLDDTVRLLDHQCGTLGARVPSGALDELHELGHRLGPDTTGSLTPADTCPDDTVATARGIVVVDFENAQWRHLAWDVAYLRSPWPTCWCSWRLPDEAAASAVEAYRRVAAEGFPSVREDGFLRDVDAATVAWALISTTVFLDVALGTSPPLSGRYRRAPTRRAVIAHRLAGAAELGEAAGVPALGALAGSLAAALRERWGDVELDLAPAFRATTGR